MNYQYWIPKKRYEELKKFCRHYREWKYEYAHFNSYTMKGGLKQIETRRSFIDPTANKAIMKIQLLKKIQLIENAAKETSPELADFLIMSVVDGTDFHWMKMRDGLESTWDEFAEARLRFFYILNKLYEPEQEKENSIIEFPA